MNIKSLDNTVKQIDSLSMQLRDYLKKDVVTKSIDRHIMKLRKEKN